VYSWRIAVGSLYIDLQRRNKTVPHLERGLSLAGMHRGFGKADRERARDLLKRARE
jgi:hypothetical protein